MASKLGRRHFQPLPAAHHQRDVSMNFGDLSDESLLRYYESIRGQLAADLRSGSHLMGDVVKARADDLLTEIRQRRLSVTPIFWPD
jgi:hypothetical protein